MNRKSTLTSKMVDFQPNDLEWSRLAVNFGVHDFLSSVPAQTRFQVYEVTLHQHGRNKSLFCCFSGGKLVGGRTDLDDVRLTTVGQCAMLYLTLIPGFADNDPLLFQELHIGKIPLSVKIANHIRSAAPGTRICFFGDMTHELDGKIMPAIGFTGDLLRIPS
jgi:hypothetical protein